MTAIAPPLRRQATHARRMSRQQVAAVRGILSQVAVVVLTIPAYISLQSQATESAVIAAGTAFGIASLLNLVVAGSIWALARSEAPRAGIAAVVPIAAASLLQLYAALTLLWHGTSGVGEFWSQSATVLAVLGAGMLVVALVTAHLKAAAVLTAALVLSGLRTLAAVFPPGWYPRTSDAMAALALGQIAIIGWMAIRARVTVSPTGDPSPAPGRRTA